MEIRRYDLYCYQYMGLTRIIKERGEWVEYEDVKELEKENERLEKRVQGLELILKMYSNTIKDEPNIHITQKPPYLKPGRCFLGDYEDI